MPSHVICVDQKISFRTTACYQFLHDGLLLIDWYVATESTCEVCTDDRMRSSSRAVDSFLFLLPFVGFRRSSLYAGPRSQLFSVICDKIVPVIVELKLSSWLLPQFHEWQTEELWFGTRTLGSWKCIFFYFATLESVHKCEKYTIPCKTEWMHSPLFTNFLFRHSWDRKWGCWCKIYTSQLRLFNAQPARENMGIGLTWLSG